MDSHPDSGEATVLERAGARPFEEDRVGALADLVPRAKTLRRQAGRAQRTCVFRLLTVVDLNPLYTFHRFIHAELEHPCVLYRHDRDYFARHIAAEGITLGAFCEGRMIAYAALRFPGLAPDNLGREIGLASPLLPGVAHLDGAAAHPAYRGERLHLDMGRLREALALWAGHRHLFGIVSPLNPYSLNSHLANGLRVASIKVDADGPNFLCVKDTAAARPAERALPWHALRSVAIDDFTGHRAALGAGLVGYRVDGDRLHYGEPQEVDPEDG